MLHNQGEITPYNDKRSTERVYNDILSYSIDTTSRKVCHTKIYTMILINRKGFHTRIQRQDFAKFTQFRFNWREKIITEETFEDNNQFLYYSQSLKEWLTSKKRRESRQSKQQL